MTSQQFSEMLAQFLNPSPVPDAIIRAADTIWNEMKTRPRIAFEMERRGQFSLESLWAPFPPSGAVTEGKDKRMIWETILVQPVKESDSADQGRETPPSF